MEELEVKLAMESRLREKAELANKEKNAFLTNLSHDMRTPLNGILGCADLAKDVMDNPLAVREYLEDISVAGNFLLSLINDVMDVTKLEQNRADFRPEPYAYEDFISAITKMIKPLCDKKNITLNMNPTPGTATILVDKLKFQQLFFNIFANAVKYTPEGGTIDHYTEATLTDATHLDCKCHIVDSGIGMSEEFQKHMFEPFAREKQTGYGASVEGTGLGLTIANRLAHAMGGELTINSKVGEGTEVIVHVKLEITTEPLHPGAKEVEPSAYRAMLQTAKILLVEDQEINIKVARKMLERVGCRVIVAKDGKQGLADFERSQPGEYDAILMDVRMPVMDGLEAAQEIRSLQREDGKTIPIIAMTADGFEGDFSSCTQAGMNAYLLKPIAAKDLYSTLAEFLKTH